ncbi:MAG: phosphoribosylformylglycinamidine cyclo-ligase, partial [Halobacillus sp.]|uniref:phosphoribosylformylglycinamidine cyclo-ligase n=1 Tax=Halobacillus sp. TaxID=56800 RepID=UPI003BB12319
IEQIVKGIADGCEQSGAALIGGETAEMPGMYELEEYDLAGFVVGMADKKQLVTGESIQVGDVLIGLSSSGVHSNGFSLVRKIIESNELDLDEVYSEFQRPLGEELLTPTRIYVPALQRLKQAVTIKGVAHITGGGFYENIPRALPEGLGAQVDRTSWSAPSIFSFLQHHGNLSEEDMFGVFNMGIGMVAVVSKADKEAALAALQEAGETPVVIGQVTDEEGIHWI